jgi:glutamate racemase
MKEPIGVFDSGFGGLTVLNSLIKNLPNENYIYFGDTARSPYGPRKADDIVRFVEEIIEFMLTYDTKLLVIACNTSSAIALEKVKKKFKVPIIGVIDSGVKSLAKFAPKSIVGVIGTEGTIKSKAYQKEIKKYNPKLKIIAKACPLFVPIVEEGLVNHDIAKVTAHYYLDELVEKNIESLVLGCTHYPLLKNTISQVVGKKINIVDASMHIHEEVKDVLAKLKIENKESKNPFRKYFVSSDPEKFKMIANKVFGCKVEKVKEVKVGTGW